MKSPAIKVNDVHLSFPMLQYEPRGIKEAFLAIALRRRKAKAERVFWALKGISLEIEQGEVVGLIGTNGSGKSTLLRTIAHTYAPDKGSVETVGGITNLQLGSGFRDELTGIENIRLSGAIMGYSPAEIDTKTEEIIEFSGIGDFIHQPIRTYSSGMKSRLGFAVAAVAEPDILLLDEVLAVGDAQFREKSMARLEEMVGGDTTVVIVSHNMVELRRLCSRVICLSQGKVALDGHADEVIDKYLENTGAKPKPE